MEYLNRNVDLAKNVESKFPARQIKVVEDETPGIINFLAIDKSDPTFWDNIAQLKLLIVCLYDEEERCKNMENNLIYISMNNFFTLFCKESERTFLFVMN